MNWRRWLLCSWLGHDWASWKRWAFTRRRTCERCGHAEAELLEPREVMPR